MRFQTKDMHFPHTFWQESATILQHLKGRTSTPETKGDDHVPPNPRTRPEICTCFIGLHNSIKKWSLPDDVVVSFLSFFNAENLPVLVCSRACSDSFRTCIIRKNTLNPLDVIGGLLVPGILITCPQPPQLLFGSKTSWSIKTQTQFFCKYMLRSSLIIICWSLRSL